ncbi:MAG: threonylcarbamoyl-AMP synthase [Bacilli bacterium]|nr:threonylcarbamoyl-AMP synthase [Bacilli bacterium]
MAILQEKDIKNAAKVLQNGDVLAFPTETVYGVGVIYDSEEAFNKLVALKKRPPNKPFALMCSSVEEASNYIVVDEKTKRLMSHFLPGEITFLVKSRSDLPTWVTLGTDTIGIRVPASDFCVNLFKEVGKPCLVTSANMSGEPTLRYFEEVKAQFDGQVGAIVQGECTSLTPTTIVLILDSGIKLVREGPVPFEQIEHYWKESC